MNITEENATQPCKQFDLEIKEIKVMMPLEVVELQQDGCHGGGVEDFGGALCWGRVMGSEW